MAIITEIDADEWREAWALMPFAGGDEHLIEGMVMLVTHEGRRQWWATFGGTIALAYGGSDQFEYRVLVSPRVIEFGARMATLGHSSILSIIPSDDGSVDRVTVGAAGASLTVSGDNAPFPDVEGANESNAMFTVYGARFSGPADELRSAVASSLSRPYPTPPEQRSPGLMTIDNGELTVDTKWDGMGVTQHRIVGEGRGEASVSIALDQLSAALEHVDGDIEVRIPGAETESVRISSENRVVLLKPIPRGVEVDRPHVQEILASSFGPLVLERDGDGDYPLQVRGVPVYARLFASSPNLLQVFAVVVAGVESSPDLLAELNAYNTDMVLTRTFLVDGQVLIESDLVASTMDPAELQAAFERIVSLAEDVGPALQIVFGGNLNRVADERVWDTWRRSKIVCEIGPTGLYELVGPEAHEPWPFKGNVIVMSAAHPFGRSRLFEDNQQATFRLRARLSEQGLPAVRATFDDGDGPVDAVVTWADLGRLREMATEWGQDLIVEVAPDGARLISTWSDRVDGLPRVSAPADEVPVSSADHADG